MDENNFFEFWNKLSVAYKVSIIVLMVGLLMCIIGGALLGILPGTTLFNFKPLAVTLIIVGGLMVLCMMFVLFVASIP